MPNGYTYNYKEHSMRIFPNYVFYTFSALKVA